MKAVNKAIALQLKKKRDLEKKGDTGVYSKKIHANQSDVLIVQDLGNQTFNQMMQNNGGPADINQSRKAQIRMRRELNAKDREKKKRMKEFDQLKDKTATVYNEIIEEMKDEIWNGYLTSSDEEQSEDDIEDE